ncbi:MAG TPA: hypothetical protein VKD91_07590, partial [Pyrinomonadaceae bacterium]|nr:hypothetical protein [Pyrinomonadaceae bacterium]
MFHQSRRVQLIAAAMLCAALAAGGRATLKAQQASAGWAQVPAILSRIKAPTFANRDFKIADYGAIADGKAD